MKPIIKTIEFICWLTVGIIIVPATMIAYLFWDKFVEGIRNNLK